MGMLSVRLHGLVAPTKKPPYPLGTVCRLRGWNSNMLERAIDDLPEAFRTLFGVLAQPFVSDVGKENAPVYFALASSFMPSLNP